MQDHKKYNLEDYTFCLEKEMKYSVVYSFMSKRFEISMVTQKKIALNTFDDRRCYIVKNNSVPCGYSTRSEINDSEKN